MKLHSRLAAIAVLLVLSGPSHARGSAVITKDALVEMFEGMAANTTWDLSRPLLWGYFFTDSSKGALERVAPLLESQGYRLVAIYQADKEASDEPDLWWLHVERIERHTPDTLDQRNQLFYRFADEHGLGSYDGMDVGPAAALH